MLSLPLITSDVLLIRDVNCKVFFGAIKRKFGNFKVIKLKQKMVLFTVLKN